MGRKRPTMANKRQRPGMNLAYLSVRRKNRKRKAKRTTKGTMLTVSIIVVLLAGSMLVMAPAGADVYYSSVSARDQMLAAQEAITKQEIGEATTQVRLAHANFERAQKSMRKLLPLRAIPYVGRQVKAARQLILAGTEMTAGLEEALETIEIIIVPLGSNTAADIGEVSTEQKREILKNLHEATPRLERSSTHLRLAEIHIDKAPDSALLAPLEEAMAVVREQLPSVSSLMESVTLASRIVPGLAGYPVSQDYFLLFQNNTELRPSGGFIGSFGTFTARDGAIEGLETRDSYAIDNPAEISVTPPWQIKQLANPNLDSWYFRDSNWSPDYPTAAENALWFYKEEGGEGDFAGVVSFTPTFLESLVQVIGPVKLPTREETFTPENVTSLIQYETNVAFTDESKRKDIIGELAGVIMDEIFKLPREKWVPFAETVNTAFAEKQLMLYLKEEQSAEFLAEQGWDASVDADTESDYVMLVDANLASLKTDQFVTRRAKYSVDFSGERPRATYEITYKNDAPTYNFKATRYRTWARLYVPEGSELVSIEGQDTAPDYYNEPGKVYEVTEEEGLNKVSFGTFVVTEIGEERTVTFTYDLPERIRKQAKNEEYSLTMQKQPGVIAIDAFVDYEGLVNESKIDGEGDLAESGNPRDGRTHELRRDAVWAMPESDVAPTEPLPGLL